MTTDLMIDTRGISMSEYRKSYSSKCEEIVCNEGEEEEKAESRAEGRTASAMTIRIGAENSRREIIMVIKKNTVFTPLNILLDFSSFEKPILF